MATDTPVGPDELMDLAFDCTPTMLKIAQLKERIKAGFGANAKVEITLRPQRVHIEISVPIHTGNKPTSTTTIIPVAAR